MARYLVPIKEGQIPEMPGAVGLSLATRIGAQLRLLNRLRDIKQHETDPSGFLSGLARPSLMNINILLDSLRALPKQAREVFYKQTSAKYPQFIGLIRKYPRILELDK
jgi:hypothetical protein